MKFLRNLLATIVGLFIFSFICFFLLIAFGTSLSSRLEEPVARIKPNSVLNLDLSSFSSDYGGAYTFEDFNFSDSKRNGFVDLLFALDYAKKDKNIKGIAIENPNTNLGIAQKKELRAKLNEFKKSGKFVLAYAENYSQSDYYLCSIADTIYLNPMGAVNFKGLSTEVLYMKNLQEKTGIKMEVIRHGKYKSAVEPFLQQEMSEANHEQISELLHSIWSSIVDDISKDRNISVETLNYIANELDGRNAKLALKNKLVDKIAYKDEFENAQKHAVEIHKNKELRSVKIPEYIKSIYNKNKVNAKDAIAIIFAQGEIRNGEGSEAYIGEESINRSLKDARENDNIKAIVLRVDSPGGSALTSELIWREIELTKAVKPVVVSMGNTAASGGYYISSNADYIFAEPNTITGSIGVFGMLPNATELANRWGVNAQRVETHKNAANYSIFSPMEEKTKEVIKENIEEIYDTFVERVSTGRKMTKTQVDSIAQGRVWTGTMAKEIGLVDGLGGLQDAIAYAANLSGIEKHSTLLFPEYRISFNDYLNNLFGLKLTSENLIKEEIGEENYEMIQRMNYLKNTNDIQAIMPFQYYIH